jgi:hypothetical protein
MKKQKETIKRIIVVVFPAALSGMLGNTNK